MCREGFDVEVTARLSSEHIQHKPPVCQDVETVQRLGHVHQLQWVIIVGLNPATSLVSVSSTLPNPFLILRAPCRRGL